MTYLFLLKYLFVNKKSGSYTLLCFLFPKTVDPCI